MTQMKKINNFKIIIVNSEEEGGKEAFKIFKDAYNNGAEVFGLATGSTPLPLYNEIVNSELDLSDRTSINLDEYVGLSPEHEQSYYYFMHDNLFKYKPFKNSYVPNGLNEEKEEVARYNKIIDENPIDLQILGIGRNAHIAFNEPGVPFNLKTHKVELTPDTIEANKRFFKEKEDVPKSAYSMGIKYILSAKKILIMGYGKKKAQAIHDMIYSEPNPEIPASSLQKHDDVYVIIDREVASLLEE